MDIKDQIREQVRQSIQEQVNQNIEENEQVDEAFGAALAVGAGGLLYGYMRKVRRIKEQDKMLKSFLSEYDTKNIVYEKFPDLFRKFKLVSNIEDLEKMEQRAEQYFNELESMTRRVDQYVEQSYREEKNFGDKFFISNPMKEKKRMKRTMTSFLDETRKSFRNSMNAKKDELLN